MGVDLSEVSRIFYEELAKLSEHDLESLKNMGLDANLRDEVGLDSVLATELFAQLSEHFDIDASMEEIMEIVTIRDAISFLEKQINS